MPGWNKNYFILIALFIAFGGANAAAQQALPTIHITHTQAKPKVIAAKPRPPHATPAANPQPSSPSPIASPPSFVASDGRLGYGPTGVDGYRAANTSSSTKTETSVMDLPQSVSIVTRQQFEDRNSISLGQALSYVPGVTVVLGEGNTDQINIRGQTTTSDFFRDGVRDDAEYYRDLYATENIEVLKGPSALIFGRGNGGGIVNRVMKKANGETIRNVEVSTGSFGRKRTTVDFGQAISDQFAVRLNGLYEQSYSYRNFFALERYGISPTLTWKPQENTFLTLSYEHFRDRRTADRGIPSTGGVFVNDTLLAYPGYPYSTGNWTYFGVGNPSVAQVNYSKVDLNSVDLNLQHKTDFGLEIRSHTVYANYQKKYQNTYAEGPLELNGPGVFELSGYNRDSPRTNVFSQNDFIYRFETTPEIKHQWLNGFEAGNQKSYNGINFPCFNLDCQTPSLDTPYFMPTVYNPISFINAVQKRNTNLDLAAAYSQDQIAITKFIDVIAGIRYDRFDLHFKGGDVPPIGSVGQTELDENGGITNAQLNRIDNLWSPRFGLVVKPFEQLSLYGSYSRSYVPMAGDQFVLLTPTLANLAPQGFQNFEAGFKAEIMPRLLFTGALYQLNRSNQPVVATATNAVLANTQTNGGELGLTGNVTDLWQVSVGWGHQGNYIRQINSSGTGSVSPGYGVGKDVPFVPKNTFSCWNKYDFSSLLNANPGVFGIGAGVIYNAKFYAALDNTVIVPGYTRVDGGLFFKVNERISGQVNIENLLGARYYVSASNNNNIMPGSPRAAYLTINAKF